MRLPTEMTMQRFLIEVSHDNTVNACVRAADLFLRSGSHFLTHADWGCQDGDHRAWLVVEVDSKEEARNIVPPELRSAARIVGLNSFTMAQVDEMRRTHGAPPPTAR
jgi:hypothetical protein